MGWGTPQRRTAENLPDHHGLAKEDNETHSSGAAAAHERIDVVDLLDEARPGALRDRWNNLTDFLDR